MSKQTVGQNAEPAATPVPAPPPRRRRQAKPARPANDDVGIRPDASLASAVEETTTAIYADVVRRSLPRRRFFNEMPDKGLFVVTAMIGFLTIVAMKISGWNADLVAGCAVGLMLIYGVVAYRMPVVRQRLDRLGDNFYYLGFIYTLASLSAALLELRVGTPIEALLGSFGIALFTTIVGVAGRVMFVQMRGEIDEVEAQVRRDLVAASEELRGQLALTLREFETLHTGIRQATRETLNESVESMKAQIEAIGGVAQTAAQQVRGAFEGQMALVKDVTSIVARTSGAIDDITAKISRMELPSERLEKQIASLSEEIERVVRRLRQVMERASQRRHWYWPFSSQG